MLFSPNEIMAQVNALAVATGNAPIVPHTIICLGDSTTYNATPTYPMQLASTLGRPCINFGVTSATSSDILNFFEANPALAFNTCIIWAGRNDVGTSPATVIANIATIVSSLGHDHFIVLSILNGDFATEYLGQPAYNAIVNTNATLGSTYGSHYWDIRAELIANYNPANPTDVTNHGNDVTPSTLRLPGDPLHPNASGEAIVAARIAALLPGIESSRRTLTGGLHKCTAASALANGQGLCGFGVNALALNTTGQFNAAFGTQALYHNLTGINNVGVGEYALRMNQAGTDNTAVGYNALANVAGSTTPTGSYNTAIGSSAGSLITTANSNAFFGWNAGLNGTTGSSNIAIGSQALQANQTGPFSVAIGSLSLYQSTAGYNIGIGYNTGGSVTGGTTNVFIGYACGGGVVNGTGNVVIGSQVSLGADLTNVIAFGTGDGTIRADFNKTAANVWTFTGPVVQTGIYTAATLPAASAALKGARAFISDSSTPFTFTAVVTGGGTMFQPVYCDGAAWRNG